MGRQIQDQSLPKEERLQIIKTLGGWGTAEVRAPLLAVLNDPLPAIREAAAQALGSPGNNEAVPALRARIEAPGETADVKAAAVRSLGRIGDRSVRALVTTLTRASEASIREAAVWSLALGSLVDPVDQTDYLIQLAEDRAADAQMRAEAIRVLTKKGKQEAIVASLSRILENEPRPTVALPTGPPTDEQIMALRLTQARDVAAWAAGGLGVLEARTALPLLLKAAEDPNDFFLRMNSVESLVAWNVPEAFPVFVGRLEDPLPEVRTLALRGLERLGDPKGVEPALGRLSDENPNVRSRAVMTLAALGGPKVRPRLEALEQKENDPEVLGALEVALSRLAH